MSSVAEEAAKSEQVAKEQEQEPAEGEAPMEKEETEPVDEENMQIAEVSTAAAKVSIKKKANSIAASDDNDDQAAACQEEDSGKEPHVKTPKVALLVTPVQIKLNEFC